MSLDNYRSPSKSRSRKGKEKGINDFDPQDLNPIITYRHLYSRSQGVRDPLRVIALCDSDAFYAACEMIRLGVTDKPLVVLQWQALIAVNYPAREYGISRMDNIKDARERCPDLIVVHVATYKEGQAEPGYWDDVDTNTHKVSLDYYRRESAKILGMFKCGLPNAEIEKASIDEAFIDLTMPIRELILQRYPEISTLPPDSPLGLDTPLPPPPLISWEGIGTLIPINADVTDAPEISIHTWHDIALSIGAELMQKLRNDIRNTLGYTLSAGISRNKFLAKVRLTASYKKPNSQSILRNAAIPSYLKPLKFQKIRFLGGKLGEAMAQEYDVATVRDLLSISIEEMQSKFGESAVWVYDVLRGIDRSEVKEKSIINKSMMASKNLPKPITKPTEGHHWIRVLAAELALRLKDAREANPNMWPKTLVLHARKGYETSRSKQAPFPFTRVATVDTIAAAGDKLWRELVGDTTEPMKVTSVQLSFTGIEVSEVGQQSIDGFFKGGKNFKRPWESVDDDNENTESAAALLSRPQSVELEPLQFICSRCGKRLGLSSSSDKDSFIDDERLKELQQEHDDLHFAQDLASEDAVPIRPGPVAKTGAGPKKRRRKDAPKGIEKFFKGK